jgi:hypothetical protein
MLRRVAPVSNDNSEELGEDSSQRASVASYS